MHTIEVDFEVLKALMALRTTEEFTYNDVIRDLLKLEKRQATPSLAESSGPRPNDWVIKGVRFAEGTEFRARHDGQTLLARVQGAKLVLHGKQYDSPSAAAQAITGYAVNGWVFWEFRRPGAEWRPMNSARLAQALGGSKS